MKRVLKWVGIGVGVVVLVLIVGGFAMYVVGGSRIAERHEAETAPLTIRNDSATVALGAHLAAINGCTDCHTASLGGQVFADGAPFRAVASNLTSGVGGVAGEYTPALWDRAIRHGIGYDGRALWIMPSAAFHNLADEDVAAIIAYLGSLPPVDNELPKTEFRPMGRVLSGFAMDPTMEVRTTPARRDRPAESSTAEYGEYLTSVTCAYCHQADLGGGTTADPASPPAPDLAAAGQWPIEEFKHALRTGETPGGRQLDPAFMPWTFTAHMSDTELEAIHAHLASLMATRGSTSAD